MNLFKILLIVMAMAVLTSGCVNMENRIACTPDDEMIFVSKYGPVGISADVKKTDGLAACRGLILYKTLSGKG